MPPGSLEFLSSVPAILGIVGFVAYHLLRSQPGGDTISRTIVDKLRVQSSARLPENIRAKDLNNWLHSDLQLRQAVSEQDFRLLQQTLRQQHRESILVYLIVCILLLVSVTLYVYSELRPKPLTLRAFRLESVVPAAKGLAVDTDTLRLSWETDGDADDIDLALQNVQTGRTTEWVHVSSTQQAILFPQDLYARILSERQRGGFNRVRAVARISGATRTSDEFRLCVGITVMAYFDHEDDDLCVTALIDNTSIPFYTFQAKVLVWTRGAKRELLSFGDTMRTPKTCFRVIDPNRVRWSELQVAYFGPDDDRTVRTTTLVDEEAIAAKSKRGR